MKIPNNKIMVGWILFWILTIISLTVNFHLWGLQSYYLILFILAFLNMCLGVWILLKRKFEWKSILLVLCGFVIGQWWLIETLLMFFSWKINGFAP